MRRIVCIGQRYRADDDVGPRVFDRLATLSLPAGVECIDGGLAGLALLEVLEGAERVVFVDAVVGFGAPGEVVVLDGADRSLWQRTYGHEAGLGYLLAANAVLQEPASRLAGSAGPACEPSVARRCWIVGVERPADDLAVQRAAQRALDLVLVG